MDWTSDTTIRAVRMYLRYATGVIILVTLLYFMATENPHTDHLLRILMIIMGAAQAGQGVLDRAQIKADNGDKP